MVRKSQTSIEYLIVIGFVTFAVMSILLLAYHYSGTASDRIKENQMEIMATKIINSAEAVFYSGEPSKATFFVYIPEGVNTIQVLVENIGGEDKYMLLVYMDTSSGTIRRAFDSNVPIATTSPITPSSGTRQITMEAKSSPNQVEITA